MTSGCGDISKAVQPWALSHSLAQPSMVSSPSNLGKSSLCQLGPLHRPAPILLYEPAGTWKIRYLISIELIYTSDY